MENYLIEEAKTMDLILKHLLKSDLSSLDFVELIKRDQQLIHDCLQELISYEYINKIAENGGGTFEITKKGKKFITSGSFEQEMLDDQSEDDKLKNYKKLKQDREEIEFNWKKTDEKRKNTNIIFVVVMAILALWNISIQLFNSNNNSENTEKTKVQIDSIKAIVSLSQIRIDSLSKIINARSTKKATDVHNKNTNTITGSSTKQK